jgi:hypothetical protein
MLKRAVALVLVLGLLLSGCALFDTTQQVLCNPTPDQQATATQIMDFLSSGVVVVGPVVGVSMTKEQALEVFSQVRAGLCVGVTQLQTALAWFEALTASTKAAQVKGLKAGPGVPDTAPLWGMLRK